MKRYLGGYENVTSFNNEQNDEPVRRALAWLRRSDVTVGLTDLWKDTVEVLACRFPWLENSLRTTRCVRT
jgi:hypothetical protein